MAPSEHRDGAAWASSNATHVAGDSRQRVSFGGYYGSRRSEIVDPGASSEAVFFPTAPTSVILP